MNMFENVNGFYPTPHNIIDKMICNLDFKMIKTILEPSAGKGNIVEVIRDKEKIYNTSYSRFEIYIDCIEINRDLKSILK